MGAAPRIVFRAMRSGSDKAPECGASSTLLGVRPRVDIPIGEQGMVQPKQGGMSVTPDDPARLPPHVRPPKFGGRGKLPVFSLSVASVPPTLSVRPDPTRPDVHVFIEPALAMQLVELQRVLCGTRQEWSPHE